MYYQTSSVGYSCSGAGCGYSALESKVAYSPAGSTSNISYNKTSSSYSSGDISYMVADVASHQSSSGFYSGSDSDNKGYNSNGYQSSTPVTKTYTHIPDTFLAPNRPKTAFIGDASEIKEFIEEAFTLTTNKPFPKDVIISVVEEEQLKKIHKNLGGNWDPGIQGFAINRKKHNMINEIFIKKGELDKIMLIIGHELGHVLSRQLDNKIDEEAKAFAFSLAWMKTIKQHNIANLSTAIRLDKPATNGLHNVALDFILDQRNKGKDALDIYNELIRGELGCQAQMSQ